MDNIGQGQVWKVQRLGDGKHVFRIPLGWPENRINIFIENHKIVKALGLPTLEILEKYSTDTDIGLICEDLNISGENIYVTPNSLYSDSDRYRDDLLAALQGKKNEKQALSFAEQCRYEYKLDELINFENFIRSVKADLEFATEKKTVIDFDSYFFGTLKKASSSSIDYIIADLDHICDFSGESRDFTLKENHSEFNRAMRCFLKHFVTPGKGDGYLQYLNLQIEA
jgi:hypothetical protein